jgi:hypothetical protein
MDYVKHCAPKIPNSLNSIGVAELRNIRSYMFDLPVKDELYIGIYPALIDAIETMQQKPKLYVGQVGWCGDFVMYTHADRWRIMIVEPDNAVMIMVPDKYILFADERFLVLEYNCRDWAYVPTVKATKIWYVAGKQHKKYAPDEVRVIVKEALRHELTNTVYYLF